MIEFLVWGVFVLVAFIIGFYFGDKDARENFKDYWYSGDEWCHDCKEYNQENHCCPRFNKVIRTAIKEMKNDDT